MPRDLSRRLEDDLEYQQDSYRRQMELDRPAKYKERISPSHRYKHMYDLRNYAESLRRKDEIGRQEDVIEDASTKFVVRGKRHNRHGGPFYQNINDEDRLLLQMSRMDKFEMLRTSTSGGLRASFELEVKEAQNSSICNYTVESIPDNRGTRMPKDLEHIKCNHAGSSCQNTGGYCCIQTYRYINVTYGNGEEEQMKIYVGCVCALQDLNNGLSVVESELPIYD